MITKAGGSLLPARRDCGRALQRGLMADAGFERADVSALVAAVRDAFPELPFDRAVLEDRGGDYRVLVLDGRYVFRFPRREHFVGLQHEIMVLDALRARCSTPTPHYEYVDPQHRFAGYRYIDGEPLTPARFALLGSAARDRILDEVAALLAALHGLEPDSILPLGQWPRAWTPAQFARHSLDEGVSLLAGFSLSLARRTEDFLLACAGETAGPMSIIHGDFVSEHLLADRRGRGLAGVIDFGDVALGDPCQDFAGLWAYGRAAVEAVLAAYSAGHAAAGLLDRSREAWVRQSIDHVWQALRRGDAAQASACAQTLSALLDE